MEKYVSPPEVKGLLNRPRTEFWNYNLVGLTHEMKSPLAAIEGALEIMNKPNLATGNGQSDYLTMIKRNVQRLKVSVNDLLGLYTVGQKNRELCFRTTDLVKICREEAERYRPAIELKGLSLDCKSLERNPVRVKCDSSKIRLVLSNLISNAVKFTQKGCISIKVNEENRSTTISVEDTGSGISTEDLPFVFDGFFQANNRNTKGSGIGLTISMIWVKAHQGDLRVHSDGIGKGSRFSFTIPIASLRHKEF